jgi:hypothetical protein
MESEGKQRHLPVISDEDWDEFNNLRKKYDRSWQDVFRSFKLYQPVIHQVLALPPEVTDVMAAGVHTSVNLMPMWTKNIRKNMPYIVKTPDVKEVVGKYEGTTPAIVIGAGPSIYDNASGTDHLEMIADSNFEGVIIATDRILPDCYEHGVFPDYVVVVDGSERVHKFFDHDIVRENIHRTTAILANHTHSSIVKEWDEQVGDILFYTASIPNEMLPNASSIIGLIADNTELNSGGNCGSFAVNIAHYMKCNPVAIIGLDLSYKTGTPISETQYYQSYKEQTQLTDEEMWENELFQMFHHPFFNTDCFTDTMFKTYSDPLQDVWIPAFGETGTRIINCTEGGMIYGDGVECGWFKDFLEEFDGDHS